MYIGRNLCSGNGDYYPQIREFAYSRAPPTCTHVARGLVLVCGEGSTGSFIKKFKTKKLRRLEERKSHFFVQFELSSNCVIKRNPRKP